MKKAPLAALISIAIAATANANNTPSTEEMWKIIQQQQTQIQQLQQQLGQTSQQIQETQVQVSATADAIETISVGTSKLAGWTEKTSIGGYGELHYNNLERDDSSKTKDEIDLHRFVLFFGHQFSDNLRFFSELEVEHSIAGEGKAGEVELEQVFIEWDVSENLTATGGVFLLPIGIMNETHEPDTFYGVERNNVEKNIIPSTWWEGGIALNGKITDGLSYDIAAHSGLFLDDGEYKIRDGRQKVGKAKADDLAYTGRIKYTGIAGLELAATLQHQTDLLQGESYGAADGIDALLMEVHAAYQNGPFALRALYASWDIDENINLIKDGADEQTGFYIEPSYKLTDKLGVFARYSEWDNTAGSSSDTEVEQWDIGLNYWLHPRVVLKADYQNQETDSDKGDDGFNLGIGFSF